MTSHPTRGHRFTALALVALLTLALTGCDRDGSGLSSPTAVPRPVPPPSVDLTGRWAGSLTVVFDPGEGSCTAAASASFVQQGASVTGTVTNTGTACMADDVVRFEGTAYDDVVTGRLHVGEHVLAAYAVLLDERLLLTSWNMSWELRR